MKIYKILPVVLFACAALLTGCADLQNLIRPNSPTRTFENFVAASQQKDPEAVKKSLSSGSLKMMEGLAKMQGKTLDQTIREGDTTGAGSSGGFTKMPETRNEKISGDEKTATLEVKNEKTAEWETLHFVKETDDWKIALDKSVEEMFKKMSEDFKLPDFGDSNSDANDAADADAPPPPPASGDKRP